jgi:hypothetical protein
MARAGSAHTATDPDVIKGANRPWPQDTSGDRADGPRRRDPAAVHEVLREAVQTGMTTTADLDAIAAARARRRAGHPRPVRLSPPRPHGFVLASLDGAPAAHWEHTVAVTGSGPRVLSARPGEKPLISTPALMAEA